MVPVTGSKQAGRVQHQSPGAGTKVKRGSSVALTIGQSSATQTTPTTPTTPTTSTPTTPTKGAGTPGGPTAANPNGSG